MLEERIYPLKYTEKTRNARPGRRGGMTALQRELFDAPVKIRRDEIPVSHDR